MCNISVSNARLRLAGISLRDWYTHSSKFVEISISFQSLYFPHCPSLLLAINKSCDHCRFVFFHFISFLVQYTLNSIRLLQFSIAMHFPMWCYKSSILAKAKSCVITLCEGNVNIHKRITNGKKRWKCFESI